MNPNVIKCMVTDWDCPTRPWRPSEGVESVAILSAATQANLQDSIFPYQESSATAAIGECYSSLLFPLLSPSGVVDSLPTSSLARIASTGYFEACHSTRAIHGTRVVDGS